MSFLHEILRSKKTVFAFKDLLLLWKVSAKTAKARVNYYVKTGELYHLRRGLYAKDENYNKLEAATKIFTPSYIGFETVLGQAGMNFQFDSRIFVASYQAKEIVCDHQKICFKKMKDALLTDLTGLENHENFWMASPERAFLDTLYLNSDYHFDNLSPLNWEKVKGILPIYGGNKRMGKIVKQYVS